MDRRKALLALAGITSLAVAPVRAQQRDKPWRIGFLAVRSRDVAVEIPPFVEAMRDLGYAEGKNVQYEWRFADGRYERLRALADDLVLLKVDVIVVSSSPAAIAARNATQTIPIVMQSANDPVGRGLVTSLARPGGNITGVTNLSDRAPQKELDLLVETIPGLSRVAVLTNPNEKSAERDYESVELAAKRRGISVKAVSAGTPEEIGQAFDTMRRERSQALVVTGSAFFMQHYKKFVDLAAKARLPAVYYRSEFVEAGGLMSYGRNSNAVYRRAATYVDKILKGAKPGDLPIEQPSVIEVVVNKKAAKAIGITFPSAVLLRADKIIE